MGVVVLASAQTSTGFVYPLIVQGLCSGIQHTFFTSKITMNFPYFSVLELRNEFDSIDLPHVGYFLSVI